MYRKQVRRSIFWRPGFFSRTITEQDNLLQIIPDDIIRNQLAFTLACFGVSIKCYKMLICSGLA